jgi:hypothetical protein
MKKAFMLVAAIALLAAPVFAVDASVSGDVSATFGYNLEESASGFQNAADIEIEIPFIDAASSESIEGDGVYGSITVEDFSLGIINGAESSLDDDDSMTGTITGKIHINDLFIGVYNTPDVDKNFAENFGSASQVLDYNNDTATLGATGGMSLGYDNGDMMVEFSVSSVQDWDDALTGADVDTASTWMNEAYTTTTFTNVSDDINDENKYVMALDADLDFGDFEVAAAAMFANKFFGDDAYIGFGVAPSYSMDFTDSMGLEVAVGADFVVIPTTGIDGVYHDESLEVILNLSAENDDEDKSNLTVGVYMANSAVTGVDMFMNLQAVFTEEHDGGLVDGLGASAAFKMLDLTEAMGDSAWAMDVSVDYDVVDGLTPSAGFGYGTDNYKFNLALGLEAGSDFTGIANTTFNLDYSSASLVENTDELVAADKGVVTLKTTISF